MDITNAVHPTNRNQGKSSKHLDNKLIPLCRIILADESEKLNLSILCFYGTMSRKQASVLCSDS